MPDTFLFNDMGSFDLDATALAKLQCNILRSTGRPRSTQIFHRFETREKFVEWLSKQPPPSPASDDNDVGPEATNVLFTAAGLRLLGVPDAKLALMDEAFTRGSRHETTWTKLRDRAPLEWDPPHRDDWHVAELRAHAHDHAVASPTDDGYVIEHGTGLDQQGQPLEASHQHSFGHFGVVDGISTLVYTQCDYNALPQKPPAGREWKFDPRRKLSTLLVRDVFAESVDAFGSYFVFRKYRQDKSAFEERVSEIAREIERRRPVAHIDGVLAPDGVFPLLGGKTGDELREAIKLLIFGRDSNGNTAFSTGGNDFNYDRDPHGALCPFHSHIRKVNPRGRTGNLELERSKSIARRGTSYVATTVSAAGATHTRVADTGLLFWSAQASIGSQFEYIMERWANSSTIDVDGLPTPDFDAVIGAADIEGPELSSWRGWKQTTHLDVNIWNKAIAFLAADYFYAPSLEGFEMLKSLAGSITPGASR